MGFRLVTGLIDHIEVVTTTKYNPLAYFHNTNLSTLDHLGLLSLVFITALSNGYSSAMFPLSVSWQWILTQEHTPDIPVLSTQSLQIS
jgi:hypothetical protein